ncbi:MAG: hypothetical protein ACNA8P_00575 [Phycisphaerales bacterium]
MKMMHAVALAATTVGFVGASASASNVSFDFTGPVPLAASQTPGAWYTDRYAPAVFESAAFAPASDGFALRHGVREADNQANRTGGFSGGFYNYQGRKFDLGLSPTPTASVSIDLYVDSTWNSGTRAGMWTTMSNGNNTFPIIEYVVDGDNGDGGSFTGFRYWQSGIGWTATALETPSTDMWYSLQIVLDATDVHFFINNTLIDSLDNQGAESISNVILQAHNEGVAGEYDVYWDNFTAMSVVIPLPGAAGMALAGMGMIGLRRRR